MRQLLGSMKEEMEKTSNRLREELSDERDTCQQYEQQISKLKQVTLYSYCHITYFVNIVGHVVTHVEIVKTVDKKELTKEWNHVVKKSEELFNYEQKLNYKN